jgi:TonB family protein
MNVEKEVIILLFPLYLLHWIVKLYVGLMPKMLPTKKGNQYMVTNSFILIHFNVNDYILSQNSKSVKGTNKYDILDRMEDSSQKSNGKIPTITTVERMTKGDSLSSAGKKVVSFKLDKINPADFAPAQFPGGNDEMIKFLHANLIYPKDAFDKNISARVQLRFKVNKDGLISDITVIQSASPALDAEAIRVVKKMPRWIPGKQPDGSNFSMCILPLIFKM